MHSKLDIMVLLLSAALGDFIIFGFLGRYWWFFDLFANFMVYYFLVATLAVIFFVVRGQPLWALLPLIIVLVSGWMVFGVVGSQSESKPNNASELRIMSYNVFAFNTQYDAIVDDVRNENPDVVFFYEMIEQSYNEIRERLPEYQYHQWEDGISEGGDIAFFSKTKPNTIEILDYNDDFDLPWFRLTYGSDSRELVVYGIHPSPPMDRSLHESRSRQLVEFAKQIQQDNDPVVVVGDFNTTPWSPVFRKFINDTKLEDTRQSRGIGQTWPTWLPKPLRIPIDHALVSDKVSVSSRRIGTTTSSDHVPLIIDVAW